MTRTHYTRRRRTNVSLSVHKVRMKPPEERFWRKVTKGPDCWLWTGKCGAKHYGRLHVDGKEIRAHRFAYELFHGPIPEGDHVVHKCGDWRCVRPEHLALGKAPVTRATGEVSVNAKLTEAEVKQIRSRATAGETMAKLATGYGVSKTTVWRIINRETWADV